MPKVTVVIPAYNAMTYLPKTVDSVLRQTFTNFEILIINDGSSDHIVEWAAGLTDPRVQLISQANQGLPATRNTGINHAQGEYIAFLDADDLWEPTKLEKQVHSLDTHLTVGVVYTWTLLIDEQDKPTGRMFTSYAEGNVWQQLLETDVISNGSSAMVRRCCFETVGVFDCNLTSAEDLDMWLRIATHYAFAVVKEPLTLYRQHFNSMSKNRQRMFENLRTVVEKTFQSVPLDLLYLRNRAYASILLNLAWLAIDDKDYKKAREFRQQALLHHPQIRFSEKCMRLSLAIAITKLFGENFSKKIRKVPRMLRDRLLGIST
jgi:glycosyltransferase involved in cell wall biosynthesis